MRRVMTIGSGAVLVSALSVLIAGCGGSPEAHAVDSTTMTTPAGPVTAAKAVTAVRSHSVPVSVQSDAAMRAAGNQGPFSSILVPSSCKVTARSATATGTHLPGWVRGRGLRALRRRDCPVRIQPADGRLSAGDPASHRALHPALAIYRGERSVDGHRPARQHARPASQVHGGGPADDGFSGSSLSLQVRSRDLGST
jgi:hypothetical protein